MAHLQDPSCPVINIPIRFEFISSPAAWELGSIENGGELSFKENFAGPYQRLNVWGIRQEFLSLPRDKWQLLTFLDKTGIWHQHESGTVRVADFWRWQEVFQRMVVNAAEGYGWEDGFDVVGTDRRLSFPDLKVYPLALGSSEFVQAIVMNTFDAIVASIHLDVIRGLKYRRCERDDCPDKIFEVTSGHERMYCSQRCAHVVDQRRRRGTITPRGSRKTRQKG